MNIKAITLIESGFSDDDATKIRPLISDSLKRNGEVIVDFDGVRYFTTLFFSQALTYLVGELGKEMYLSKVKVINLTESGADTYQHAVDYAIEYYAQKPEGRKKQDDIIEQTKKEINED